MLEWKRSTRPRFVPDPEQWEIRWGPGIRLVRKDGVHELLGTGRLLLDGAVSWVGDNLDATSTSGRLTEGDVRQGRLTFQGRFFHRFLAKLDYEFAEQEFRDFFVGAHLSGLDTLRLGYFREPFSLEQQTGRTALVFMERSLMNALVPRRNVGIGASNTYLDGRLRWSAGAFHVVDVLDDVDDFGSSGEDWNLTARITGLPVYEDSGRRLFHLGLSYSHSFSDQNEPVSISQRPESFLAPNLVDTGNIEDVDSADRWGFEMAFAHNRISMQSEAVVSRLERASASSLVFWGGYLQASWFITGEHRVYGQRVAAFGRIVPQRAFNPRKRRWGALQLAARGSYVDLVDNDVRGGVEWNGSLALNWFLRPSLRLSTNYVYARVLGEDDSHIVQARFQLDL